MGLTALWKEEEDKASGQVPSGQWQWQEQEQRGGRQASAELGGPGQGLLTTHLPPAAPGTGA